MTDAMLRAACDAERAHDGASPCHFCPERCGNEALAAAIRAAVGEAANEIERLRAEIVLLEATGAEAADEIERLRSAMRELLADTQHAAHACGDPDCPVDRACALLTEGER